MNATPYNQRQDSTFRPARLVAWLVCERNRLILKVEALRIENALLKKELRVRETDLHSHSNGELRWPCR